MLLLLRAFSECWRCLWEKGMKSGVSTSILFFQKIPPNLRERNQVSCGRGWGGKIWREVLPKGPWKPIQYFISARFHDLIRPYLSGDSPWGKPPSKNGWIPGTPYDHWKTISYTTFGFHVMWVCECSRCLKPYWSTLTDISYLLDKGKTLTQKCRLEGGYMIVPRCSSCCFSILAMNPGFLCVWIFVVFHGRSWHGFQWVSHHPQPTGAHIWTFGVSGLCTGIRLCGRNSSAVRGPDSVWWRGGVFGPTPVGASISKVHPEATLVLKNLCKPVNNRNFIQIWVKFEVYFRDIKIGQMFSFKQIFDTYLLLSNC